MRIDEIGTKPSKAGKITIASNKEVNFSRFSCKEEDALRARPLNDERYGQSIRSPYSRDRDRILFTKSFRVLSEKTQVYLTSESSPSKSEYTRTRLTHTLEVANIAKTISRLLGLNCELVEAMAYGHDVGHPPFGHAGEEQLDLFLNGKMPLPRYILDCLNSATFSKAEDKGLRKFGDFKHNFQSVRQLSFLFSYDYKSEGLNLTYQCLEGILKHTGLNSRLDAGRQCKYPEGPEKLIDSLIKNTVCSTTLERKIVSLADEIAQVCHDLNDAINIGVIPLDEFIKRDDVKAAKGFAGGHGKIVNIAADKIRDETNNTIVCSNLVEFFTRSTYEAIKAILTKQPKTSKVADFIESFSDTPCPEIYFKSLEEFKDNLVINNYSMNRMDNKGMFVIRKLIEAYLCDPRQLPDSVLKRYYSIKSKELSQKGEGYVQKWFGEIEKNFGVKESKKISPADIAKIINLIRTDSEGTAFRKIDSSLVRQLKPYLALDGDYVRTITDHIAMMTDISAEREMIDLYGH